MTVVLAPSRAPRVVLLCGSLGTRMREEWTVTLVDTWDNGAAPWRVWDDRVLDTIPGPRRRISDRRAA